MNYYIVSFLMCLLVGCGVVTEGRFSEERFTETSEGFPLDYVMASSVCHKELSLKEPQTNLFSDGAYKKEIVQDFDKRFLEKSIGLGGEFEIDMRRGRRVLIQKSKPSPFDYCIQDEELEINTFEDATLSVLSPLRKFMQTHSHLLSTYNIPKVNIQILPKYSNISRHKVRGENIRLKKYMVNNAMYIGATDTLVFLPQGQTNYGFIPFKNVPLWKSPAVVMHEYGHHFFSHITLDKVGDNSLKRSHTALCLDNRPVEFQSTDSSSLEREEPTKIEALLALNEGFADIFSFYSLGEKKQFFKSMDCMENSRDVQKSFFYSGKDKLLSSAVIKNYLSKVHNVDQSCRTAVDYQDPHMIGAIFAHSFYSSLEGMGLYNSTKLSIILNWAKALENDYKSSKTAQEVLEKAADRFYQSIKNYRGFTKEKCEALKQKFPTITINC